MFRNKLQTHMGGMHRTAFYSPRSLHHPGALPHAVRLQPKLSAAAARWICSKSQPVKGHPGGTIQIQGFINHIQYVYII